MSFKLTSEKRGNYLYFHVTGTNSPETVLGYMAEIQQRCEQHDCYRILIDENLDGPRFDEFDVFALISTNTPDARGFFEAIAYVDAQQDFDVVKFAETVAVNRGIPVAVFDNVDAAESWLSQRSGEESGQDIFVGNPDDI